MQLSENKWVYRYVIENIVVIAVGKKGYRLGGEGGGAEIHCPEHQAGGGEINTAAVDDAEDFGAVQGEISLGHGHAKPRDAGEAAGPGHVVESSAGVEVMAAAGASADGGSLAVAAVGKRVTAETDNQVRVHRDLRKVICSA